ncbi:MAG: hypothetical protein WC676_03540 [Candidatus Omnitrophota bacterium]
MKEKTIERNGEKIIEVRSDGGKLLFIKTKTGYEMKCPRTKTICLVKYEEMLKDCVKCLEENVGREDLLSFIEKDHK